MDAESARRKTETSAERMRIATDAARENARTAEGIALQQLEEALAATVAIKRQAIDMSIEYAADAGKSATSYVYVERISASMNSREEVDFVEEFASTVSQRLLDDLQAEGYIVASLGIEVPSDLRNVDSPPEYYETSFNVSW